MSSKLNSPAEYRTKPEKVIAFFYEGGTQNAEAIVDWLESKGFPAWHERSEKQTSPVGRGYDVYPEAIKIGTKNTYQRIAPKKWIVITSDNKVRVLDNNSFKLAYERVDKSGGAVPAYSGSPVEANFFNAGPPDPGAGAAGMIRNVTNIRQQQQRSR